MRTLDRLFGAVPLLLVFAACGAGRSGPEATLEAYGKALEKGEYAAAYRLMSESFRAKHSKEEFVRILKESDQEVRETAARLRGAPEAVEVSAEFTYGLGDQMRLVQEDGSWRIASNPMDFYGQATPRDALRSFIRAYELERWRTMLRFVPNKYAERMTVEKMKKQFQGQKREEIAARMNMIKANLDEPITEKGNEARMRYGDRYEVSFVREDQRWKIKDID